MANRYRFSLFGEPLGICFDIVADNEKQAVTRAQKALFELVDGIGAEDFGSHVSADDVAEDVRVYLEKVPTKKELRKAIVDVMPIEEV